MGLVFRKSKKLGETTRLNLSKSGLSNSRIFGPLVVNSRGRASLRPGEGISWRFR
ncbi:hypothetical protein IWX65_000414 [Arthrobacter sp. CAN_A214]|uniref:DUF4236 domain-containing protein n=1 Tax=Arthrobacter sp. CAN_A214 TaxID=2787720 RepID=UPI0018CAB7FC